ncbi:ABC transporter substrate-binding protein [Sulfurifustis variabilis]|uniref:Lipopolysaccharide export system protein LptA n=2 Tax=Sulfurifustis variabilis TaxID=1675686 RepID=A0A1B4V7A5_9GAMM|nr:ABC transporter substrate-binding protein [Sulfurifustis variabilis]
MCRLAGFALALCAAPAAFALKSDANEPINIRAASVDANEKTGNAVYRGNVVMTQGSLRLEADRVDVAMRDGRLDRAKAFGKPARLRSLADTGEEVRAHATRIDYRARTRVVDLEGKVWIKRGGDVVTGATARYELDTQRFTARGANDGQVTAVIQPRPAETPK